MKRRTATRIGALVVILTACAAAWAVLAPPELGGSTRYVVTEGSSMEPKLHAGDLALVREQESVGKGDVVLYEHPRLGVHVLHRIVRETGGHFVLKGDNNDFLDDARPAADDVDGKLWIALPRVGSMLMWAREPLHAALIVFALTFFALGGGAAIAALRRPAPSRGPSRVQSRDERSVGRSSGIPQILLAVGLAGLVVFAFLAVVSASRPATRMESVPGAYAHVGSFSYGATVEPSDVYSDGRVDTGEAVFLSLVDALDVEFAYRLRAESARAVRGTTELTAVLSDGAGWKREIPITEEAGFVGTAARATGSLDIAALVGVVEEMRALTGSGTSTFSLGITADVVVRGQAASGPIRQELAPKLPLLLDTVSLRPDAGDDSPFTVREEKAAVVEAPAPLAIGGLRLSVEDARRLSLLGLAIAAVLAALGGAAVWRTKTGGEPSQIASLFGDRLITISRPPSVEPARVTELRDAESLCRLAEHHNRVVLHWRESQDHVYEVEDGGSVYRYRVGLGLEPGVSMAGADEDTLVLAPTKLPPRAAAG